MVELGDTLEVKDLRINLADKEMYQLTHDAKKAEYYYDQVKSWHF